MVSRKAKLQATQFICNLLEASNLYDIHKSDYQSALVSEKQHIRESPRTIQVLMANVISPFITYQRQFGFNRNNGIFTAPVLYKDGRSAFVRLVDNNAWRADSTLKNYHKQEINKMLRLRKVEKDFMGRVRGNRLTFYQPITDLLPESVRLFDMQPVTLDYSHIGPGHPAYDFTPASRESIDFKLPELISSENNQAEFKFLRGQAMLARIYPVGFN